MRVRFAPSPTGYLHLGNARVALFNYLHSLKHNGELMLRIDDTGPDASEKYEGAIEEDLKWLGITWSLKLKQSHRLDIYQEHFERLKREGLLYPCFCTPEELERERREALKAGRPPRYSGKCRSLPEDEVKRRLSRNTPCCWRFRVPEDGAVKVKDLIRGEKAFLCRNFGDFVVRRSDGSFLYMFTSAVDDALTGIDLVIRGEDHYTNTPLQVLVMEALGYRPPEFAHLPLLTDQHGRPFSKRLKPPSVRELKEEGYIPEAVDLFLVLLGTGKRPEEPLTLKEMARDFNLKEYGKSSCKLDIGFLRHCNRIYMRKLEESRLCSLFRSHCPEARRKVEEFVHLFRENADTLRELCLFYKRVVMGQLPPQKLSSEEEKLMKAALKDPFTPPEGVSKGRFFKTLRRVLTGMDKGPPLKEIVQLLGEEEVKGRIEKALEE